MLIELYNVAGVSRMPLVLAELASLASAYDTIWGNSADPRTSAVSEREFTIVLCNHNALGLPKLLFVLKETGAPYRARESGEIRIKGLQFGTSTQSSDPSSVLPSASTDLQYRL